MIKTLTILAAMFGATPIPSTTPQVAVAVDTVCGADTVCQLDAITSCWLETRCQLGLTSSTGAAGPWQQQPEYAYKIEGTRSEKQHTLNTDAMAAMKQFAAKRARYSHEVYDYGRRWPLRYAGVNDFGRKYLEKWKKTRAWVESIT